MYCLLHQVRPDRLDDYRLRHRAVWPDLLAALRDTGWRNYSLFLRSDGLLIGYVEAEDLAASRAAMAALAINQRWQAEMAEFFEADDGRRPDESFEVLEPMFHLDEHVAAASTTEDEVRLDGALPPPQPTGTELSTC